MSSVPDQAPPLAASLHSLGSVVSALGLRWHLLRTSLSPDAAEAETLDDVEKCLVELQVTVRRLIDTVHSGPPGGPAPPPSAAPPAPPAPAVH